MMESAQNRHRDDSMIGRELVALRARPCDQAEDLEAQLLSIGFPEFSKLPSSRSCNTSNLVVPTIWRTMRRLALRNDAVESRAGGCRERLAGGA